MQTKQQKLNLIELAQYLLENTSDMLNVTLLDGSKVHFDMEHFIVSKKSPILPNPFQVVNLNLSCDTSCCAAGLWAVMNPEKSKTSTWSEFISQEFGDELRLNVFVFGGHNENDPVMFAQRVIEWLRFRNESDYKRASMILNPSDELNNLKQQLLCHS